MDFSHTSSSLHYAFSLMGYSPPYPPEPPPPGVYPPSPSYGYQGYFNDGYQPPLPPPPPPPPPQSQVYYHSHEYNGDSCLSFLRGCGVSFSVIGYSIVLMV
ncbi:uncharacterized protein A4U43_C09F14550 [Asparagus officinalis]|uniref:Cysteine-rich transmembrane CYSTM domain-containing protein n=1 Tax=Asparagus officinalis TaxID=4686 RepID=A0A5P1E7D5_ASPOF|nr:uncharacterized protein A4U43_C09F14550 [Asparagus officinalis]